VGVLVLEKTFGGDRDDDNDGEQADNTSKRTSTMNSFFIFYQSSFQRAQPSNSLLFDSPGYGKYDTTIYLVLSSIFEEKL
jgi:hypothetical protein